MIKYIPQHKRTLIIINVTNNNTHIYVFICMYINQKKCFELKQLPLLIFFCVILIFLFLFQFIAVVIFSIYLKQVSINLLLYSDWKRKNYHNHATIIYFTIKTEPKTTHRPFLLFKFMETSSIVLVLYLVG